MTRSTWLVLWAALALAVGFSASRILADDEGEGGGDKIEHLMERVHKGKKSPLKMVKKQLENDQPAWDEIAKQLPKFEEMSKALTDARKKAISDAAGGYSSAVDSLVVAVNKKDQAGAKAALKDLNASCADCHRKGGVAGKD